MDYQALADLLFPNVTETSEEVEARFPARNLPEGAVVSRMAPSPTGFVHLGNLVQGTISERMSHQSGGVLFLRVEDTDAKREVPGAVEVLIDTLKHYGIQFDEGATHDGDSGIYGPYRQRQRADIYHVFAKKLVKEGKAYPCFCTEEELTAMREQQEAAKVNFGYYGQFAMWRDRSLEDIQAQLNAGNPWVLRFRSTGSLENQFKFDDVVKGKLTITENDIDHVLLKSDGIPTYHFAHAVDDHLMGTTHVIRGEEWLPSLSKHIMLFRYLGFKLPKYLHIAQIMRLDENGNKKKLSKRDMGANMDDYSRMGYAPACVCEYIMTLLNSNYEEWHAQNADKPYTDFPFNIKKMSVSGCLFDFNKLNDVSKNVISRMSAKEVTEQVTAWALQFDPEFGEKLARDPAFTESIFAIGRGGKKPRKDLATWADAKPYMGFFFDGKQEDAYPHDFDRADIKAALEKFLATFDIADDMNTWFEKIKAIAREIGYADDMKAYKASPEEYRGSIADVSMFLRVAVTGKMNAPDLYTVMQILGKCNTVCRIESMIERLD